MRMRRIQAYPPLFYNTIYMNRVIIIGCPGAGKSTFARKLRDATGLPLHYLDMLSHRPDRTKIPREEFDRRLDEILATERWIVDGHYQRTLERRIDACDTIFFLDFPTEVCLAGAESRVGIQQEDLPWRASLEEEFRRRILEFPVKDAPAIYDLLDKYRDRRPIIIFRSRSEAEKYILELGILNWERCD